jgi:hypothetical protein
MKRKVWVLDTETSLRHLKEGTIPLQPIPLILKEIDMNEEKNEKDNWADLSTSVCGTCMWFVAKFKGKVFPGRCRRHSPKQGDGWPAVYPTDWCGDHKINQRPV